MAGLTVYLNRDGLNTVETDKRVVHATHAVDIILENHGKPTHVHLHLDDDLATLGNIQDPHWFIPNGEWREVKLQLSEAAEGNGRLEITAGYGQERESVNIEVESPEESEDPSASATDKIDTVGAEPNETRTARTGSWIDEQLGDVIDPDRLRNPIVLGAGGAFIVFLVVLLVIEPLAAVAAALGALLVGIAVLSYLRAETAPASEAPES